MMHINLYTVLERINTILERKRRPLFSNSYVYYGVKIRATLNRMIPVLDVGRMAMSSLKAERLPSRRDEEKDNL